MAELADAHGSGPCDSNVMRVQVPFSALNGIPGILILEGFPVFFCLFSGFLRQICDKTGALYVAGYAPGPNVRGPVIALKPHVNDAFCLQKWRFGYKSGFPTTKVASRLQKFSCRFTKWRFRFQTRAENSITAIVTDPPYGVREYTESEIKKQREGKGGIWRIPPTFDGHIRQAVPRFSVIHDDPKERENVHQFL